MKSILISFLSLFFVPSALLADAGEMVSITDAYVRAVPPGMMNSASFMTIANGDNTDHAIVKAESTVAKTVELHTHVEEQGMMKMRQIEKIDLPEGKSVELKPGGLHVMLIGLNKQLVAGEFVKITLHYADGSKKTLSAPIKNIADTMMHHEHHHH